MSLYPLLGFASIFLEKINIKEDLFESELAQSRFYSNHLELQ
jgi:hypothetical protein